MSACGSLFRRLAANDATITSIRCSSVTGLSSRGAERNASGTMLRSSYPVTKMNGTPRRAKHFGNGKAHLAMEVDVEDRPVERLVLRQFQAALQPSRRADDLAAAVLQQDLGHFGQQEVVLDDQDLQAFQQPRRQHDAPLPSRFGSDRRNYAPRRLGLQSGTARPQPV